jgi:hypothetical protein
MLFRFFPDMRLIPSASQAGKRSLPIAKAWKGAARIAPNLAGHAYTITADVDVSTDGGDGVIVAQGGRYGGISLLVKDHRVIYEVNAYGHAPDNWSLPSRFDPARRTLS